MAKDSFTVLPLTNRWIAKMAKSNEAWAEAWELVQVMNETPKASPKFYITQESAVAACIRAMMTMDGLDEDALWKQADLESANNMANRVNYAREFRYDVIMGYLHDMGYFTPAPAHATESEAAESEAAETEATTAQAEELQVELSPKYKVIDAIQAELGNVRLLAAKVMQSHPDEHDLVHTARWTYEQSMIMHSNLYNGVHTVRSINDTVAGLVDVIDMYNDYADDRALIDVANQLEAINNKIKELMLDLSDHEPAAETTAPAPAADTVAQDEPQAATAPEAGIDTPKPAQATTAGAMRIMNDITKEVIEVHALTDWDGLTKAACKFGKIRRGDISAFHQDRELFFITAYKHGALVTVRMRIVQVG